MRLSTIFELLLILLLVAFAAYGRVIDRNEVSHRVVRAVNNVKQMDTIGLPTMSLKQAADSVNRYCTCNENICNCCRDFHIPLVQLKGPGCASLQYLQGDNLAVQLSFGDNILTSTIVNGKSPRPVCVPLPGGFTKFCGRIYSIQRDARNHFKACLGLELQSATELEASLRVSCFRFGPDGLKLRPAEPLPDVEAESTEEDDDDDDFFGLGTDDDDDDDDEDDETLSTNSVPNASGVDDVQGSDDDDDEDDILGFSAILDIFTGDDDTPKRPKATTAAPLLEFTIPILPRPTTPTPLDESTFANELENNDDEELEDNTHEPGKAEEEAGTALTENNIDESTVESQEQITEASNKIAYLAKPDKDTANNDVKKGVIGEKKKPTVTSTSVNAIHDPEKPVKKPIKDENNENADDDDDLLDDDDDDEDDEDEDEDIDDDDDKDDEDENEEDEDKIEDEKHEEQEYDEDEKDLADLADDDDDEEEEAVLNAFMQTGKSKKDKGNAKNQTDTDEDYSVEFLARKRHPSESRQSKITRF
ncbi:aspartic and glutamic acid-rich protein [Linepithema humile]|uniref:aspartic and glutamic acid-rich protein n=1 Tax=Linepithema humile TaxID=83485 RepID=UPI0006239A96|nr:PREDICTED: protein PFC0760c [Linepithema humile]